MEHRPKYVKVGHWTMARTFEVIGSMAHLTIVQPGCNCTQCLERIIEVTHTLMSKKITYYLIPKKPDGWAIAIELKGTEDPIKQTSDAIGLPIAVQ